MYKIFPIAVLLLASCGAPATDTASNEQHLTESASSVQLRPDEKSVYELSKRLMITGIDDIDKESFPANPTGYFSGNDTFLIASTLKAPAAGAKELSTFPYTCKLYFEGGDVADTANWTVVQMTVNNAQIYPVESQTKAAGNNEAATLARIKQNAKDEYPDDYSLQKFQYENEVKAYHYMQRVTDMELKAQSEREYPEDYMLQKFNYEQQAKAKRAMQ